MRVKIILIGVFWEKKKNFHFPHKKDKCSWFCILLDCKHLMITGDNMRKKASMLRMRKKKKKRV